jgi:nucleosome-remodeling factor subunit
MAGQYSIVEKGAPYSKEYRVYIVGPNGFVSPFHDIPLIADAAQTTFNMVVEVPRWTNAKMEISKDDKLNPIKQDIKKDKLRFVDNCFPHHGYIWNYGALPQTWEDPNFIDPHTNQKGDNDPIDVCEIGFKVHQRGAVVPVKVLGIMALIDEGETDWKIIAIDVTDPLAASLNDIDDVEKHMPGFLKATNEWFRIYKIPTGKPENKFAFNGEAKNKEFALNIIKETHEQWKKVVTSSEKTDLINCTNTSVEGSGFRISQEEAKALIDAQPTREPARSIPAEVDKWNYVKL